MKFEIYSTNFCEGEELLNAYPCLKDYGFEKVSVEKSFVTIDTVEQLVKLSTDLDESIIIHTDPDDEFPTIEIYDDYRE